MDRKTLTKLALLSAAAVSLAACGGGGGGSSTVVTPPPPPPAAPLEDHFGTQFGVNYRASADTEPVKPAKGDIIPLTLTSEPMALH